jgi:thiosulfate/3-mercaptopyruvate sulfurtransferase
LIAAAAIGLQTVAFAAELPGPLVSTAWLAANQDKVLVLDIRNDPTSYKDGGHIIGAVRVDFKALRHTATERGVPVDDVSIAGPAFEAVMRAAGVRNEQPIVLTHRGRSPDDTGYAAYVYWQLKVNGHDQVALLDGGTTKWIAENREVWGDDDTVAAGDFTIKRTRDDFVADTAAVEDAVKTRSRDVLDARFFSFYVGLEKRPAVAKAGHIPGATLFPFDANFEPDGTFRTKERLAAAARSVGLSPSRTVLAYCNSGHVSAISWFVLHELLGYPNVAVYDGSMLAWGKHDLPAETSLR